MICRLLLLAILFCKFKTSRITNLHSINAQDNQKGIVQLYMYLQLVFNINVSSSMTKPTERCMPNKDSDQPGHPPGLISLLCVRLVAKDPRLPHGDSED